MFVRSGEYVTSVYARRKLVCCVESSDKFLGIVRLKFVGSSLEKRGRVVVHKLHKFKIENSRP